MPIALAPKVLLVYCSCRSRHLYHQKSHLQDPFGFASAERATYFGHMWRRIEILEFETDANAGGRSVRSSACLHSERSGTGVGETRAKRRQRRSFRPSHQQRRIIARPNTRHTSGQSRVRVVQHLGVLEPLRRLPVPFLHPRSGSPELSDRRLSWVCVQGSLRVSLDWLERVVRPFRSCYGNVNPFPDRRQQPRDTPAAGVAHKSGPGRDVVARHRGRSVPIRSRDRRVSPLFPRSR